jgi:uncharacterized SAM-binding protein YcdF (DUF218 family)
MKLFRRRRTAGLVAIGIFLLAVWISPALLLRPMAWCIYRHDHPDKNADAVLLLMGEPAVRPVAAARALHAGYANKLIFVTPQSSPLEDEGFIPSEEQITMQVLGRQKRPLDQIIKVEEYGRATSTADEALAMARYLREHPGTFRRIVVVTSWPHSSRAGWILEKVLSGLDVTIEILPIDRIPFSRDDWWRSERGLLFVFEEYIKYARYYIKYLGRDMSLLLTSKEIY